ncbi:MAG TPA: type IV pilus secretin PilQ [Gallionellaceae bacterium]|nr:type IV pilus secretin PilQ [Gallionellaceae bacterium]
MNLFDSSIGRIIRFVLVICALQGLSAHALGDTPARNSIEAINVSATPDGNLVVAVTMKQPPSRLPGNFSADNPARVAFDFMGATNDLGKSQQEVDQGDLRSMNIVQAGDRTRVVLNLAKMMAYSSKIEGNNVLITLASLKSQSPKVARFAEPSMAVRAHSLRDIDFHRGNSGEGKIEVTLSDPGVGIDLKQQGSKIIVNFMNTVAPRSLQRKLDVVDFSTPVESIDTFAQGGNMRMVITPKGLWEYSAYQTDEKFVVEVRPKIVEHGKENGKPVYVGEKLTLNFQNIAVREALGVIADFTGLNIVISDSVSGNLTLRLKDVPWDQALDIILQSKGLDMVRNGNVIQIGPAAELAAHRKVMAQEQHDIAELEPLQTESFRLSYQKGSDIVKLISDKTQPILSKRGSAVVDTRTNTVFVHDTASSLDDVRKLIKQIDVPVRQVMIEARFVGATQKFERDLGGRLGFVNSTSSAGGFHVGAGQLGNATGSVNLAGASQGAGGLTFSLFNPANTKTLQLELYATEIEGSARNIASPRVVTADNIAATISSGTQIPYQQATSSGATSIAFMPATLQLKVTPKITPDNRVNMKLMLNQDTVGATFLGMPSIDSKKVQTEVLVENGGTVAIGGVYTKDTTMSVTKVPLLGDLPIIGWFFKNTTKQDNKSELLIFITPKILQDSLNLD